MAQHPASTGTRQMKKSRGTKNDKAMKKTFILFATAFVALVSCNKELEPSAPVESALATITASAPETKATVDGLQVQWTTGDQVAMFQTGADPVLFTLVGEGPVTTGTFSASGAVTAPNGLAAFPAAGAAQDGTKVSIQVPSEFAYGTTPIPMIGVATSQTAFGFHLCTGAINIIVKDIPPYPCNLVVTADKNITGTLEIPNYANPTEAAFAEEGAGKTFTVTGLPKGNINITLPMLPGTYSLEVKLLAADMKTVVHRSLKEKTDLSVVAGQISRLKTIDLEYGNPPAPYEQTSQGTLDIMSLPGKWNVLGDNSTKNGIKVFGGGGGYGSNYCYPAFVCPYDKTWDWTDPLIYRESDNELIVKVTGMSSTISGTINWWAGADGKFWDYIWKYKSASAPQYDPFYGTDLSGYYDKIPRGENPFYLNTSTMHVTLSNGETPALLTAGTYSFCGGQRTLTIPDNCFALMFHLGNMKPVITNSDWLNNGSPRDIDRFMFSPLEYIIIFERTGDL